MLLRVVVLVALASAAAQGQNVAPAKASQLQQTGLASFQERMKEIQEENRQVQEANLKKINTSFNELVEVWKEAMSSAADRYKRASLFNNDTNVNNDLWSSFFSWLRNLLTPMPLLKEGVTPLQKPDGDLIDRSLESNELIKEVRALLVALKAVVTQQQEQPSEEQPSEEQPSEEQRSEEQRSEEQRSEEQRSEEQRSEKQPSEKQPYEEQRSEEQPSEQPSEEQPSEEQPSEEQPSEEQPYEEQPYEEQPYEEQPSEEQPSEEQTSEEQQNTEGSDIPQPPEGGDSEAAGESEVEQPESQAEETQGDDEQEIRHREEAVEEAEDVKLPVGVDEETARLSAIVADSLQRAELTMLEIEAAVQAAVQAGFTHGNFRATEKSNDLLSQLEELTAAFASSNADAAEALAAIEIKAEADPQRPELIAEERKKVLQKWLLTINIYQVKLSEIGIQVPGNGVSVSSTPARPPMMPEDPEQPLPDSEEKSDNPFE